MNRIIRWQQASLHAYHACPPLGKKKMPPTNNNNRMPPPSPAVICFQSVNFPIWVTHSPLPRPQAWHGRHTGSAGRQVAGRFGKHRLGRSRVVGSPAHATTHTTGWRTVPPSLTSSHQPACRHMVGMFPHAPPLGTASLPASLSRPAHHSPPPSFLPSRLILPCPALLPGLSTVTSHLLTAKASVTTTTTHHASPPLGTHRPLKHMGFPPPPRAMVVWSGVWA